MKRIVALLFTCIGVAIVQAQEIQRPVRAVGDWCEYASEGVGVAKQRREVIEVAPDGGWTLKTTDESGEVVRVFDADGRTLRRGNREHKHISSSGPLYPISTKSRGRVIKQSYPHARRTGITIEVTSEIKSVEPETLTVPAGSFDTLRVQTVLDYRYHDRTYSNQMVDTVWYALDPKLKFPVKSTFVDYGSRNSEVTRLLSACGSTQPAK